MKTVKYLIVCLLALGLYCGYSQTNILAQETSKENHYELTLGTYGVLNPSTMDNQFGVELSLYTNPLIDYSSIWFGVSQSLSWEPSFSGSTDFSAVRSTKIVGELYINTGWSGGVVYDAGSAPLFRSGPEVALQYYIGDNSFIYIQGNYDLFMSRGDENLRYGGGIGLTF